MENKDISIPAVVSILQYILEQVTIFSYQSSRPPLGSAYRCVTLNTRKTSTGTSYPPMLLHVQ